MDYNRGITFEVVGMEKTVREIVESMGLYKLLDWLEPRAAKVNKWIGKMKGRQ